MLSALQITCEQPQCDWKGRADHYDAHKKEHCLPQKIIILEAVLASKLQTCALHQRQMRELMQDRDRRVAGQFAIIEEKDATIAVLRKTVEEHVLRRRMRYFIDQMSPEEMISEAERMGLPAGCPARTATDEARPVSEDEVFDVPASGSRTRSSRTRSRSPPWRRPARLW